MSGSPLIEYWSSEASVDKSCTLLICFSKIRPKWENLDILFSTLDKWFHDMKKTSHITINLLHNAIFLVYSIYVVRLCKRDLTDTIRQKMLAQSPKSERSDLRFEASKPVFVERDMAVDLTDLYTERSVNRFENWILQPMA